MTYLVEIEHVVVVYDVQKSGAVEGLDSLNRTITDVVDAISAMNVDFKQFNDTFSQPVDVTVDMDILEDTVTIPVEYTQGEIPSIDIQPIPDTETQDSESIPTDMPIELRQYMSKSMEQMDNITRTIKTISSGLDSQTAQRNLSTSNITELTNQRTDITGIMNTDLVNEIHGMISQTVRDIINNTRNTDINQTSDSIDPVRDISNITSSIISSMSNTSNTTQSSVDVLNEDISNTIKNITSRMSSDTSISSQQSSSDTSQELVDMITNVSNTNKSSIVSVIDQNREEILSNINSTINKSSEQIDSILSDFVENKNSNMTTVENVVNNISAINDIITTRQSIDESTQTQSPGDEAQSYVDDFITRLLTFEYASPPIRQVDNTNMELLINRELTNAMQDVIDIF